jgi:competence protein ComEC
VGGIFLSSFLPKFPPATGKILLLAGLISGLILISVFWQYKKIAVLGFCILFFSTGIFWQKTAESKILNNELKSFNDKNEKITLTGIVNNDPEVKEKIIKLQIEDLKLEIGGGWKDVSGKVLVTTRRYPEYQYGDKLKIIGKLETPPIFESFNYRDYLKKDGIYSVMNWPEIEAIGFGFGNPVFQTLFSFKNKFKETAQKFIPPPQEGFLEALIFGDEENIPNEWKNKLNFTGTRHIAAVSGMNITIISALILNFLLALGFWRGQAFYFSIILLVFYILTIGAPASAVRAGIMGGLFLTAQQFGRLSAASRAVVFASTIMLFLNPLLLRLDVGFQLSFLAIIGMIYLQPIFSEFLKKIPSFRFFPLRTTLAATLSAQVFTLPILIYNFGYMPLISPLTNILIVPFLAPITILIFIFSLTGMIFSPLGYILSFPTWLSLAYLTKIIDIFSRFPLASLKTGNVSLAFLVVVYLILGITAWRLQKSQELKFLQ